MLEVQSGLTKVSSLAKGPNQEKWCHQSPFLGRSANIGKKKTCGFSAGGFLNFWSSKLGNTPGFQGFPNGTGGLLALHGGVVLSLARGMGCGLGENYPRKSHG